MPARTCEHTFDTWDPAAFPLVTTHSQVPREPNPGHCRADTMPTSAADHESWILIPATTAEGWLKPFWLKYSFCLRPFSASSARVDPFE